MRMDMDTLVEVLKIVTEACVDGNQDLCGARFGFVPRTKAFAEQIDGGLKFGLVEGRGMPLLCFYDRDIQSVFRTSTFHQNDKEKKQNETIYKSMLNENANMAKPMLELRKLYDEYQAHISRGEDVSDCDPGHFSHGKELGHSTLSVYARMYSAQGYRSVLETDFFVYAEGRDRNAFVSTVLEIVGVFCKYNELRLEYKLV